MTRPTVVVWRNDLLPPSETFIRNQVDHCRRVAVEYMGVAAIPGSAPLGRRVTVAADRVDAPRAHLARIARRSPTLERRLRAAAPLAMHAHFGPDATIASAFARRAGLPLVATFHGFDVTSYPRETIRPARRYRARLPRLFRSADALLAVSDFVADRLVDLGAPADRVRVQPIGIPLPPRPPTAGPRSGVLFVGRLVAKKGVDDLLDAVARLERDQEVVVLGDGPMRAVLEARAVELGVPAEFRGTATPEEVATEMGRAAVLCAPSKTAPSGDAEGLGMVFLEAAAHGLPVVSYRHGGVGEAVEDGRTGLLAPEGDVAALSAALGRVLDTPRLAADLGARGRTRVEQRFDIVERTAELEELYLQLGAGAPSATIR